MQASMPKTMSSTAMQASMSKTQTSPLRSNKEN